MSSLTPKVKDILVANGCTFARHGKGDHDIWHSPHTDRNFPVDHTITSRHTANGIMKQAGLPKQF